MNLELHGFKQYRHDAQEALALIVDRKPDCVTWRMPVMDGPADEALRLTMTAALPIIMLTAKSQTVDKVLGLTAGADDYLVKPLTRWSWLPGSAHLCGASRSSEKSLR